MNDAGLTAAAAQKMPGHWLLAKMGKRVLRPGGRELTQELLTALAVAPQDDVVEFAPGLGVTARLALERHPRSYTGVERDEQAAQTVTRALRGASQRCITGSAEATGPCCRCNLLPPKRVLSLRRRGYCVRAAGTASTSCA